MKRNPLVLMELRKTYTRKKCAKTDLDIAIRNLSLSLNKGEIFGLLGPKRSGKTTVLNLISHETFPEKGQIKYKGKLINIQSLKNFHNEIGYCSQNDSFWPKLTLYEHLVFYAFVRKIPEYQIHNQCQE